MNTTHIELKIDAMNRKTAKNGIFGPFKSPFGGVRGGLGVRGPCGYPVGLYEPLMLNKVASKVISCGSRRVLTYRTF